MPRKLVQPLNDISYLENLIRRGRERQNTLGDLCRFAINEIEITPKELFDLLGKHGLDKWTPLKVNHKKAARKAITRIRPMLEDASNNMRVIVRPVVTKEPNVTRYAIVDETTDLNNQDLDFTTRNQVLFRSDTGTLEFTGQVVPEIVEMFNHLCSVYTDSEITHMITNIVSNHGCVWMNDHSGMFFIGHPQKQLVDSLLMLFDELRQFTKSTCYFRPIGILDDAENRATMGEALALDLSMGLKDATEALDKAMGDKSKRGINAAISKFRLAQSKATLYKDMLQINITEISRQVDEANTRASAALTHLAIQDGSNATATAAPTNTNI